MRKTEAGEWIENNPSKVLRLGVRLAVVALGVGLVMTTGAARAGDDDDDDKSFEQKIIGGIMAGIGGTNMENRGIDYRERSPLVVPPRLDLPPPAEASTPKVANWPKDPDETRRKKAVAERKKVKAQYANEDARPLTPDELNAGRGATAARDNDPSQPGAAINNSPLNPAQLGFDGSLSTLFGGKEAEVAKFKGEPTRESLTQPPVGYQTPSPNYAYGVGMKDAPPKEYNPVAGKYGD